MKQALIVGGVLVTLASLAVAGYKYYNSSDADIPAPDTTPEAPTAEPAAE